MADTASNEKYTVKEISNDPEDYITGPRRGEQNRTHGGTTNDGRVQVLVRSSEDDTGK